MKMQTSTLEGPYLDAAVGMAEGLKQVSVQLRPFHVHEAPRAVFVDDDGKEQFVPGYSTDWRSGGYIIDRERIGVMAGSEEQPHHLYWTAEMFIDGESRYMEGPTALIAAMRSYVCRAFGDEVEIAE